MNSPLWTIVCPWGKKIIAIDRAIHDEVCRSLAVMVLFSFFVLLVGARLEQELEVSLRSWGLGGHRGLVNSRRVVASARF
jgi:hypothetical protein